MPKKKKSIADLTLPELNKEILRRKKRIKVKISRLERKKQTLQNQIKRVDEKIKELNKELGEKQPRKAGKKAGGRKVKKGKRARGKARLPAGVMRKALVSILTASKAPMSPKDLRAAVIAKKIYEKVPSSLNKIISGALRDKGFKKVGKGKYVLRSVKAKGKSKNKAKETAKKEPQKKAKEKVKKEKAKVKAKKAPKEKVSKEEKPKETKEEEKEKGE